MFCTRFESGNGPFFSGVVRAAHAQRVSGFDSIFLSMGTIDLTTNAQFDPSTWIGVGKTFSNDLENVVYDKKREILKVPDPFLIHLPTPTLLVNEFLKYHLPIQSSTLSFHPTGEWFSTDVPLSPPEILLTRPIPPARVLKDLDKALGQEWFDGANSIVDPRFNNRSERFPFWALSLWKEMEKMIQHQRLWDSSIRWLKTITHPEEIVAKAKSVIEKLPWNKPLGSGGATTLEFAGFLGVSWLSDTQINLMIKVLRNRLEMEDHTERVLIEPIEFTWELESVG